MLKSIQIYYKDPPLRRGDRPRGRFNSHQEHLDIRCRQLSRQRRRKCLRLLRLRPSTSEGPQRSDKFYLEAPSDLQPSEIEPVSSSPPTTPRSTTTTAPWARDIGSHFAEMADAFAQSINGLQIQRVQYSDACPKIAEAPICEREDKNQCWSVGRRDRCKDSAICCFNGCHNVCFDPNSVEPNEG